MGFKSKTWDNTVLNTKELNRIEQGITNAHSNIEILNSNVESLFILNKKLEEKIERLEKTLLNINS